MSQNIAKSMAYESAAGGDLLQSTACTSWPVAFNEYPSTCGHMTSQKQTSEKANQSKFGSNGVVVIS